MSPATPRCALHPGRAAGWRCTGCRRQLCPACLVEVTLVPTGYLRCGPCGSSVDVLTRPGTDITFPQALRRALLLPLGLGGLFVVFTLAATASEFDRLPSPGREGALLVWSVAAWLVGVAIVRATAEGATTLRGVTVSPWPELLRPALLAAACTAPALAVPRTGPAGAGLLALSTPVLVAMLLGVIALRPLPEALSPVEAAKLVRRLGSDGVLAAACVLGLWLFARMLGGLGEAPASEVPPLWTKMLCAFGAGSLFLVPHVLGLLLQTRGEEVGYAFRTPRAVPVLAAARAEVRVPYQPPDAPRRARPAPIALEEASGRLELTPLSPDGTDKQ